MLPLVSFKLHDTAPCLCAMRSEEETRHKSKHFKKSITLSQWKHFRAQRCNTANILKYTHYINSMEPKPRVELLILLMNRYCF